MSQPAKSWGPIIIGDVPLEVSSRGILEDESGLSPRYGLLIEKHHFLEFFHRIIPTMEGVTDYRRVPFLDWGDDIVYFRYGDARIEIQVARSGAQVASALAGMTAEGVKYVTKLGTCGATAKSVPLWSIILSTGAVRDDGTSDKFLPPSVPAIPDWDLTRRIERRLQSSGTRYLKGVTHSVNARHAEPLGLFDKLNVHAGTNHVDMETATAFVVGRYLGLTVAAVNIVVDPAYEMPEAERSPHMNLVASYDELNRLLPTYLMTGLSAVLGAYVEIDQDVPS